MSELHPQEIMADPYIRRFREYIAASIAGIIILGTFVLIALSFVFIENNEQFTRAKDLLLIVNPFVGVVIGYYFNKVSTDARAEHAEDAARTAEVYSRQAFEARQRAEVEAEQVRMVSREAVGALSEMTRAAERTLSQVSSGVGENMPLGSTGFQTIDQETQLALMAATTRARRVLKRTS